MKPSLHCAMPPATAAALTRRSGLALLGLAPWLAGPAQAGESGAPELPAFAENFAPLSYLEGGEARGFACELLRLMAAEAGLPVRIAVVPWQRAVTDAAALPASLLLSLVRLPERESRYRWVGPIAPRRLLIYRLTRRTDVRASQLAGLHGLRVGVTRESAAAAQLMAAGLQPGKDLELGLDDAQNLRKLLAGRMDAIVLLDLAAAWQLQRLGLPASTLTPMLPLDLHRPYWLGLPADSDPELARRLQEALDQLRRDGRYEKLRSQWFG